MLVMFANAFVMSNSAAGAISIRPDAAGTASGAMGFLQMGDRRAGLAIRRISRRPFCNAGGAQRGHFRFVPGLRIDHDLPHSPPQRGGQRGTDRAGGGRRIGDALGGLKKQTADAVAPVCRPINGVIARESGRSSTPRLLDSITTASGILDHPLSRLMTMEKWRERAMNYRFNFQTSRYAQTRLGDPAACFRASFALNSRPLQTEGAGNAGRPMRPIAACAMVESRKHTR
jgi:hypothetical protein